MEGLGSGLRGHCSSSGRAATDLPAQNHSTWGSIRYLFGIQSLLKIWSHEFTGTIPLCADDWHYRAEGHDSIVAGYHGDEPLLKGKILRLAKQCSIQRFEETCAGHPAVAYNEFVSTLVGEYLGMPAIAWLAGTSVPPPPPLLVLRWSRVGLNLQTGPDPEPLHGPAHTHTHTHTHTQTRTNATNVTEAPCKPRPGLLSRGRSGTPSPRVEGCPGSFYQPWIGHQL